MGFRRPVASGGRVGCETPLSTVPALIDGPGFQQLPHSFLHLCLRERSTIDLVSLEITSTFLAMLTRVRQTCFI